MSDPDTDPYTAYYEFEPVDSERTGPDGRAEVLHELGLAGSPCTDREWGTKVEVRCPGCGTTGKVVSWDDAANVYACRDCGTDFVVPASDSANRPTERRLSKKRPAAGR